MSIRDRRRAERAARRRNDGDPLALVDASRPLPLVELRRAHVRAVLEWVGGDRTRAARLLGIDERTLGKALGAERGDL